jgi:hypothetical protein
VLCLNESDREALCDEEGLANQGLLRHGGGISFRFSAKLCMYFCCSMHVTCSTHLTLLDMITLMLFGDEYKIVAPRHAFFTFLL